jgi:L-rhamnose-H+ transport protein
MPPNPIIGVLLHWLGGFAAASFYIPYKAVRRWSWETYWLVGGVFSWIIAPWFFALILVPDLLNILLSAPPKNVMWAYIFGVLWGMGGLTFGLTMRYLGIALGMGIALGYCAVFGTLLPPIFSGEIKDIVVSSSGQTILGGVFICLLGIVVSGLAGISKEKELPEEQKRAAVKEFNLTKGLLVATFSGIMSSCFAYGLAAGTPIAKASHDVLLANGASDLWQNLPVLIIVLLGGFTTNFIWCVILNIRNRSTHEYLNLGKSSVTGVSATEAVSQWNAEDLAANKETIAPGTKAPLLNNYFFAALAGITWYLQFFFYGMGETRMGDYKFSSWTMHMASIIIFSTLWGIALKEWKGTSRRTHVLIGVGLALLILSTIVVGAGNFLKGGGGGGH